MATRTFTTAGVNNLWSNAANWDTGVPLNTDTAVIPVGQDCEFDVDQSAFAAGVTVTLNGTLHASTTAGSYVLKLQANMTGSGTLRAGTSGTPYPTNCTFEVMRGGFEITATSMTLDLNCSEPTTKYIKLTGVETAGQTVLSVDTDVTGETAHWKDGALVRICDVNFGNDNEEYTIAVGGVAAGTLTITAGLADQKEAGAYIVLVSRNVKITHTAASGNAINGGVSGRIFAEIRNANNGINGGTSHTAGGTISGCASGFSAGGATGFTISSALCGNTTNFSSGFGHTLIGVLSMGAALGSSLSSNFIIDSTTIFAGCTTALSGVNNFLLNGTTITGCGTGVSQSLVKMFNVTLDNTTDLSSDLGSFLYNCLLGGTTEHASYTGTSRHIATFTESIDHDQSAGAYKAWTRGGIVTNNAVTVYPGRTVSYQHACESSSYYVFRNYSVTIDAGGGLVVQCYIRKDAAMAYLPRVWILLSGNEPFISGTPDYEDIMTNSINTWEELNLVYANGGAAPVTVTVRTLAKDAGPSNVYFDPIITSLAPATYSVFNVLQADLDDIQTRLPAALVGGRMDSSVGAMQAAALTQINNEVVDALTVDTYAEPVAVPAATSSIASMLHWVFTLARNPIRQTATQQTLRNDADAADIGTAQVSDNGVTATRDEWV